MTREELIELAKAKGTDKAYRRWVNLQPSCISGKYSEWHDGIGYCEGAHVNRIKWGSGRGKKADYSAVPLTREEHRLQHQHGEEYFASKDWWEAQALKYLAMWVKS